MKTRVLILSGLCIFTLAGCGKNYQGSYTGTKTVTVSNQLGLYSGPAYGQPTTGQTPTQQPTTYTSPSSTLTLNQSSGNTVTGTWQSANETGSFTAVTNGDSLQNVQLTINPTSTQGQTTQYYGQAPSCPAVYTGNLNYANNSISGSLAPASSSQCGISSISINLVKYGQ